MKDKLNIKKLGLSLGIVVALGMFAGGLISMAGYGTEIINLIGTVYRGYNASIMGSIIGAVYGFIDGFIGGVLIAWIYNKL
jgi:hypothetical protein